MKKTRKQPHDRPELRKDVTKRRTRTMNYKESPLGTINSNKTKLLMFFSYGECHPARIDKL